MPLMPVLMGGKLRMIEMAVGAGAKEQYRTEEENLRRASIWRRRMYYEGGQYDQDNLERAEELRIDLVTQRMPEHERLHAYSTQIGEAVDFLADQLADRFEMVYSNPQAQSLAEQILMASDQFTGMNEDDEVDVEGVLREALIAGDVPVEILFDPVDGTVYFQAWDSEQVEFQYQDRRHLERVIRTEVIWALDDLGEEIQVRERVVYELRPNGALNVTDDGVSVVMECVREVWYDEEEAPRELTWLGLPVIPWSLLVGDRRSLRAVRGESVIMDQAMEAADRYNANEQVAWLIARYNSHGNLAVVGDAAMLKLDKDDRLRKDVADVLKFPGGTSVTAIELPTDPQMIQHQATVLAEAIYDSFGLTRVEPDTINSLGGISGYALEILNRKTEGTFRRVRRAFSQSIKTLLSKAMDCQMYWTQATPVLGEDGIPRVAFWTVDPLASLSDRACEVRLGSGYIVDVAMVRADFTAKLISRRHALRQLGYSETDIDRIMTEIDDEAPPAPEVGLFGGGPGSTVGKATTKE